MPSGDIDNDYPLGTIFSLPNLKSLVDINKIVNYINIRDFERSVTHSIGVGCNERHQMVISTTLVKCYVVDSTNNNMYYNYVFDHDVNDNGGRTSCKGTFQMWGELKKGQVNTWLKAKRVLCTRTWLITIDVIVIFANNNYFMCQRCNGKNTCIPFVSSDSGNNNNNNKLQLVHYNCNYITSLQNLGGDNIVRLVFVAPTNYNYNMIVYLYFRNNKIFLCKQYDEYNVYLEI